MAGSIVAVDDRSDLREAINRIKYRDSGNSDFPALVVWRANDAGNWILDIDNAGGKHLLVADILNVQDTVGVSITGGNKLLLFNADNSNSVNLYHSETDDIGKTDDSLWVVKALGVGLTPSGLADGEILASGDIGFRSGQADAVTFRHAVTAARDVTFQDLSGYAALLDAENNAGHLLFLDNTYDIGASGATRPRNIYAAGLMVLGGALTTGGVNTLGGHLLFNPDNTHDIGASAATRPRDLFLARNLVFGGSFSAGGGVGTSTQVLHGGAAPAWGPVATADIAANAVTQIGSAVLSTSGPTIASTTPTTIAELEVTLTFTGGPVIGIMTLQISNNTAGATTTLGMNVDGAGNSVNRDYYHVGATQSMSPVLVYNFGALAAGSHTIRGRWNTGNAAHTTTSNAFRRSLDIIEIKR